MSKIIDSLLKSNKGVTFYGGEGFDYVCLGQGRKIECSGSLENMTKYANKNNWAVAVLIPVRFSTASKEHTND
jgi:hypothetical protein